MSQPKPRVAMPLVGLPSAVKTVAPGSAVAGLLGRGHQLQRGLLEREGAGVADEAVEQCLGEEADVGGGGEDAGLACNSAHAAGGGVVDRTPRRRWSKSGLTAPVSSLSWAVGAVRSAQFL